MTDRVEPPQLPAPLGPDVPDGDVPAAETDVAGLLEARAETRATVRADRLRRAGNARATDDQVLGLWAAGLSYGQMARQLGYASHSGARAAVQRALRRANAEVTPDRRRTAREKANARLEHGMRTAYQIMRDVRAPQGGRETAEDRMVRLAATKTFLGAVDQQAKLLGLDLPPDETPRMPGDVDEQMAADYLAQVLRSLADDRVQAAEHRVVEDGVDPQAALREAHTPRPPAPAGLRAGVVDPSLPVEEPDPVPVRATGTEGRPPMPPPATGRAPKKLR